MPSSSVECGNTPSGQSLWIPLKAPCAGETHSYAATRRIRLRPLAAALGLTQPPLVAQFGTSAPSCRAARRVHSCKASLLLRPSARLRAKRQWNTLVACRARGRSPVPFKLRRCPSALSASTDTVSPSFFSAQRRLPSSSGDAYKVICRDWSKADAALLTISLSAACSLGFRRLALELGYIAIPTKPLATLLTINTSPHPRRPDPDAVE